MTIWKQMPLYKTRSATGPIGIYSAQRPSSAACKAFTVWRQKNKDLQQVIYVETEGHKNSKAYTVTYETVIDPFLGTISRPIAVALATKSETTEDAL